MRAPPVGLGQEKSEQYRSSPLGVTSAFAQHHEVDDGGDSFVAEVLNMPRVDIVVTDRGPLRMRPGYCPDCLSGRPFELWPPFGGCPWNEISALSLLAFHSLP